MNMDAAFAYCGVMAAFAGALAVGALARLLWHLGTIAQLKAKDGD